MSSAASSPPEFPESAPNQSSNSTSETSPDAKAQRRLMGPPKRPQKPPAPPETPAAEAAATPQATQDKIAPSASGSDAAALPTASEESAKPRQHPISAPSEPMQYRAIGLLRGRYIPSEESFNRGHIVTEDETQITTFLLGRVTSLVKKHLDMDSNHLWVVYPRTNPMEDNALNVQIVGVWEPETLGLPDSEEAETSGAAASDLQADYFSIRGEVAKYFEDKQEILISIVQKLRSKDNQHRSFKLLVKGQLEGKTIGYFWDLHVERQGQQLVLRQGTQIAAVPPKKHKRGDGPGGKKRFPPRKGGYRRGPADQERGSQRPSRPISPKVAKPVAETPKVNTNSETASS